MSEKRRYSRRSESLQMFVKFNGGDMKVFTTRDVSDGGIFLLASTTEQLPIGTEIILSPAHYAAGGMPPSIKARVVRSETQGMGIEFGEPRFA